MIYCSLYDRNSFCIFRSPSSQRILFLKWIEILLVPPTSLIVSDNIPLISRMIGCDLGFQGTFGNRCFIVHYSPKPHLTQTSVFLTKK